ncbi:hypothetical protein FEM48_Zijuj09G0012800 [Ziziphus jujuba var. spinosa]|uniref:Vacuolar protein sorting-associated protein 51 homolog n=1 Tax=Ziziphus jujuba var. spinosa TaxID=714518 RepID=A0A978UQ23_ZIZJJ|nr:hypothetical protein FEM48_Zijuj09G0012800 [Ziziphus jujuba var. spinosa]
MPIFKAYGDSSFQDCKRASEEAVTIIIKNLQGKLFSDSESIQARAEAAVLLKQLNFPVDSLQAKLLEKLEQSLEELQLKMEEVANASADSNDPSKQGNISEAVPPTAHEVSAKSSTILVLTFVGRVWAMDAKGTSVREFAEAVRAYRVIFPDSDEQLTKLAQALVTKHFESTEQYIKNRICAADLLHVLGIIWKDVLLMDDVLPEAALPDYSLEAARVAVKQYVANAFSHLLHDISDALMRAHNKQKEGVEEDSLQVALEASKKAVLQGSMDALLEGFQNFFGALDDLFLLLSGRNSSAPHDNSLTDGTQGEKVFAGLVLEIAASFSGGGVRGYEYGPPFVPGEICRIFHSAGEKLLNLYINMRTQRVSILLKKRFTTPNWVKHKEPREVHMFVDLFLHELESIGSEVKQILPQGLRKHRRNDSNGSTASSRSNPLREEKLSRSNTQRARSQLLETHLAKLFKQKVEVFTKVEFTQESVITMVVKLCLKSLQEFVRLQTFNRSGFQQIQLDIQFLRTPVREAVEDEAAIDFLLDEVIVAAADRCLDPNPLEPPILDKLIQAKLAKAREYSPMSS